MTALTQYTFEGRELRALLIDGEPWFVAADVCHQLDLSNVGQALAGLDDDEKSSITIDDGTPGNPTRATVSEAGLYSLILRSRKPEAKAIKRWVTHTVLPSIRKTGQYGTARELTEDELIHKALTLTAAKVESLTARLALVEPKAAAFDRWLSSNVHYGVAEVAQVLHDLGAVQGRNRLFEYMYRSCGWIYRDQRGDWRPYQAQVETGRLAVKLSRCENSRTGEEFATHTVRITAKGAVELARLLNVAPADLAAALSADEATAA